MEASAAISASLPARDGGDPIAPGKTGGTIFEPISGAVECACCGRAPLIGERVSLRARRNRSSWLCALCSPRRSARRFGRAVRTVRVRSIGGALNVRRL